MEHSVLDDVTLIRRVAQARDRAAFELLYRRYAPKLRTHLRREGVASTQAEELAQEIMLTVWTRATTFDPEKASFAVWLYRVARNKRIDALRRMPYPEWAVDDDTLAALPDRTPGTEERAAAAQTAAAVRAAVAGLSPERRQAVHLAYDRDLSHGEIARLTHLPVGTVKSRLRLAAVKLRLLLAGEKSS